MKISVLMTVYNGGAYLKAAIESVLAQSFKDFEFLIVNDASKDNTLKTIASYNDERIKVITNAQNLGQTASLNVGLRAARGEYVGRIDADDKVYPSWLQEQLIFIEHNPSCTVVSMRAVLIDSRDKMIKELNTPSSFEETILKSVFASPINHVGCLMCRKDILQAGLYDEQYRIVADYDLWCRLLRQGKEIVTNPKILTAVRTHAQSVSMLEADKRVTPEMASIILQNVLFWSGMPLTQEEAVLIWRLIYAGHTLELREFMDALGIFQNIYDKWQPGVVEPKDIQDFCRKQVKVIFLKRIWGSIKQSHFSSVRQSTALYMKTYGSLNVFLGIWLLSFLGAPLIVLLNMYEYFLVSRAEYRVGRYE